MVASAVSKPNSSFKGIRPFDPTRDLFGVGQVLEESFRPEGNFPLAGIPFLRDVGVFMWTLGYAPMFPERVSGFVYIEEGKIVGNVTLTLDQGHLDRYFVSNVAVRIVNRRRGIARELMQTAIAELRRQGVNWILLNVRPNNPEAIQLYEQLGFQHVEMNGEWSICKTSAMPLEVELKGEVRPLRSSDHLAVKELIRAATPANVLQFRAPRIAPFSLDWDDRVAELISDFFVGQTSRRWAVERNGKLIAILFLCAQRGPFRHRLAMQVHPDARGEIESQLIAYAFQKLENFLSREIRAAGTSRHPEMIGAMERAGFEFRNGLTLMALAL